jgi:DNA polymerase I
MPYIDTATWTLGQYPQFLTDQLYNGLDCCITTEVHGELSTLPGADPIYSFERALQAPAMEMMLRGFLIDEYARQTAIRDLGVRVGHLRELLNELAHAVWDRPLNARSGKQLMDFFYGRMGLPKVWTSKKGERKLSMDRETLEKLEIYFYARPFVRTILAIRDLCKTIEVLETEVDPDGFMRTSYNVAGTETGRWSSSSNAFGTGGNLQNIARELRYIFVAPPGWKICGIDLEQAESREVGWLCGVLFGDWTYYDACLSGDLHTTVARLAYPEVAWTGNNAVDRALAEERFYREYSRRDLSKKLGHGSNYYGKPPTMARHSKIPVDAAAAFQANYFNSFPGIPLWHQWTAQQLQTKGYLVTPFGRKRHFFGRGNDDTTLREAIAYVPQSSTGDRLNLALWRIWRYIGERVRLLAQVHDAVYFLFPEEANEEAIVKEALDLMNIPLHHAPSGRTLIVPGEAKTGWNWGDFNDNPERGRLNPHGLRKLKGTDNRAKPTLLGRIL